MIEGISQYYIGDSDRYSKVVILSSITMIYVRVYVKSIRNWPIRSSKKVMQILEQFVELNTFNVSVLKKGCSKV